MSKKFRTVNLDMEDKNLFNINKVILLDSKNLKIVTQQGKELIRVYQRISSGAVKFQYKEIFFITKQYERQQDTTVEEKIVEKIVYVNKEEVKSSYDYTTYQEGEIVKHQKYDTIKSCIQADIPVYLVGDAGTGKNFTLEAIAKELGMDFYFTNSVQQEYKLTGFIDAGGNYHETEFYKAFKNGGVFFLDEMDASIPEVLVLLNAAIANRYFEFPNGKIQAHPNFRVVAAGNTVGSGADELYTGRLVLDQATLDRFVVIEFDYDKNIELSLAKGNTDLVDFIEGIRNYAKENGIRATFSYRCIMNTVKLEKIGLNVTEILRIAIFKGMNQDTINLFNMEGNTQYEIALKGIQQAA